MFWFPAQCRVLIVLLTPLPFRTVLELGSGIGFTGIAICKTCQPRTFVFSDCHPRVLRQLGENIRLNGFIPEPGGTWNIQTESQGQEVEGENCQNPKVMVAELDWGSVTEKQLLGLRADVVIAAGTAHTQGEQGWAGLSNPGSLLRNSRIKKKTTTYRPFLDLSVYKFGGSFIKNLIMENVVTVEQ